MKKVLFSAMFLIAIITTIIPIVRGTTETRYLRSDEWLVNGLTAEKLQTAQSTTSQGYELQASGGDYVGYWGTRVWKRSSGGAETEITSGTPVAQVSRSDIGASILSTTWNCPVTSLLTTDAIVVRVYVKAGTGGWYLCEDWITEQLNAGTLSAATWTIYYYAGRGYDDETKVTFVDFTWGTNTYNSRITNFTYAAGGGGFDFTMSNSGGITVQPGNSDSNTITITLLSGTTQSVSLSASGLPSGASATFNPSSGNPTFTSVCTVTTSTSTPVGLYTITVTGTGGGLTRTTTFALLVGSLIPTAFKDLGSHLNYRWARLVRLDRLQGSIYEGLPGMTVRVFYKNPTTGAIIEIFSYEAPYGPIVTRYYNDPRQQYSPDEQGEFGWECPSASYTGPYLIFAGNTQIVPCSYGSLG